MISVQEVIPDPDMTSPEPFTVQRSTGQWVAGGFQSTVTQSIPVFGPVRNATDKEVAMLPEADRVSRVLAFYATLPILTTRGTAPVPATHGEVPAGAIPGSTFTLSSAPPGGVCLVYLNGLQITPGFAYQVNGATITLTLPTRVGDQIYVTWPITANVQAAEADVILYEGFSYRILSVYRVLGSGYWKALGTRIQAS